MTDCPGCDALAAKVVDLTEALAFEVSRRTLGGTPPAPDVGWANLPLSPPDSAADPAVGGSPSTMASSLDPRHWA